MTIHIVSDFEGTVIGAYSDIKLVYEAVRNYYRKYNECEIEKFNEDLLRTGIEALSKRGFHLRTFNFRYRI